MEYSPQSIDHLTDQSTNQYKVKNSIILLFLISFIFIFSLMFFFFREGKHKTRGRFSSRLDNSIWLIYKHYWMYVLLSYSSFFPHKRLSSPTVTFTHAVNIVLHTLQHLFFHDLWKLTLNCIPRRHQCTVAPHLSTL